MQLDFTNLFHADKNEIIVHENISLPDFEYSTYHPLKHGVNVQGRAYNKADVAYLELEISFDFEAVCDRCADEFQTSFSFPVSKIVVAHLENEDDEGYIVLEDNRLDLAEFVYQEVQLFLPQKMLCSDDCKGLCATCGKNLNHEQCNCAKEVDPRMAALLQLLDE